LRWAWGGYHCLSLLVIVAQYYFDFIIYFLALALVLSRFVTPHHCCHLQYESTRRKLRMILGQVPNEHCRLLNLTTPQAADFVGGSAVFRYHDLSACYHTLS
jgi:hypothetical protein